MLTVSQAEAELIGSLVNGRTLTRSVYLSERLGASAAGFEERSGMLFVGSFNHPPNADAVRFACEEILPLVSEELRREHPLYVVGDSLDETVRGYADGIPTSGSWGGSRRSRPTTSARASRSYLFATVRERNRR